MDLMGVRKIRMVASTIVCAGCFLLINVDAAAISGLRSPLTSSQADFIFGEAVGSMAHSPPLVTIVDEPDYPRVRPSKGQFHISSMGSPDRSAAPAAAIAQPTQSSYLRSLKRSSVRCYMNPVACFGRSKQRY